MDKANRAEQSENKHLQARSDKLKEIDSLYREQIKKIYGQSKIKLEKQDEEKRSNAEQKKSTYLKRDASNNVLGSRTLMSPKSSFTLNLPESQSSSKMLNSGSTEDKVRASVFLKGQSTRTIQILRRQNQSKELKIRELSNKCENLVQKLKKYLNETQFQQEMENLRQFSDGKMERLQHLFKIKQQEIFFKIKLQIIGLLQQFGISKEELAEFSDISSESNLFTLMVRKLKNRLKDFRSKEQQSSFELQRDKILNQKQEERIHYLTETNQLLKLSETKMKSKVEDLKYQLNEYLDKMKLRERQNQKAQNQVFRLRKQNEELQDVNHKLSASIKNINSDRQDEKRLWEAKQKEMKVLLNNYYIEKKKLETDLQEKDGEVEEILIKYKFLEQENQRINRELVRWKERYEWIDKERTSKIKELEDEKNQILVNFEEYKLEYNQGVLMNQKGQVDEALRKIEDYQRAYQRVVLELQDERNLLRRAEDENKQRLEMEERQWLERFKNLEKIREEQLYQINEDCQARLRDLRKEHEKKEELLSQEMQARLRALLAQRDKNSTEQMIQLQTENDQLKREIMDLNKIIEVKESLINVINSRKV